jgi:predicted nucleic acid-binding protein
MKTIFLDTVGLIALWDQTDQWHAAALKALDEVDSSGARTVTTDYILLECGNAAARRAYRPLVVEMREVLLADGDLIAPTEQDVNDAWSAYALNQVVGAGIVDHVSFAVMRRLGITDAFTNDRHFRAAGFKTLF